MLSAAQTHARAPVMRGTNASLPDVQAHGHAVRLAAAELFRQGRLAEADQLTREALLQHPASEDVLVIRALICEVQHDWPQAAALLERLVYVQGAGAPADTWCHWVRVLRCDGQHQRALAVATEALGLHPLHPVLSAERMALDHICHGDPLRQAA